MVSLSTESIIKHLKTLNSTFDYSKVEFKDVYHPIKVICDIHGEFDADPLLAFNGVVECPSCNSYDFTQKPNRYLFMVNKKFVEPRLITTTEIAKVRNEISKIQSNMCPLCERPLNRPVLDHWHTKRNHGNGCVRLTLCATCNSLLGRIENALPRYKIPYSIASKWLINVADYITMGTTSILHPTEKPTYKVLKSTFKKLEEMCVDKYGKFPYKYPKNGVLTNTKLITLYLEFKDILNDKNK